MVPIRRPQRFRPWRRGAEEEAEYFLMLRVDDCRLDKKSALIRYFVSDPFTIPPFHHITLYGPFSLMKGRTRDDLFGAVESACQGLFSLDCRLDGWVCLKGRKGEAIAHDVRPAGNFLHFYHDLWHLLAGLTKTRNWIDIDPGQRRFHISHAYNLRGRDAGMICGNIRDAVNRKIAERKSGVPDDGKRKEPPHVRSGP